MKRSPFTPDYSIYLGAELKQELKIYSAKTRESLAKIIRKAIKEYIRNNPK